MSVPTRKMPAFCQDGRRHVNRRAAKLIRQHAGEIRKYEDLPQEAQLALAHYMAIDGEAWELAPGLENLKWDGDAPVKANPQGTYDIAMPGQTAAL